MDSGNCIKKLMKDDFCVVVSKNCTVLASPPITMESWHSAKAKSAGFDRFSLTLSPSLDCHFQTNRATELGLVSFWSYLLALLISTKEWIAEINSNHIYKQALRAKSIFFNFFVLLMTNQIKINNKHYNYFMYVIYIKKNFNLRPIPPL